MAASFLERRMSTGQTPKKPSPSSFRDPSGFIFFEGDRVYRQVNAIFKEHYDYLIDSGLYAELTAMGWLIPHEEVDVPPAEPTTAYKVLLPEKVFFWTYPYEWAFSQLKDAALATMNIQRCALAKGMYLKDCSAYNIQFIKGRPVLIDTLSFERYREGEPWVAYRQFCQHFLAPLALMSYRDIRLSQLLRTYLDGIPLDLASALLPRRTWVRPSLFMHIHLHAKSQKRYANRLVQKKDSRMRRSSVLGIVDSLERAVRLLRWKTGESNWSRYYFETNYSSRSLGLKRAIVSDFLDKIQPKILWDLGANTGMFSRLAAEKNVAVVSMENDPVCVEKNYVSHVRRKELPIIPLWVDLTNPSPSMGWLNQERASLTERGPADAILALALVHHLRIANNVPFSKIADFFQRVCRWLIIEFAQKNDSQVQRLLQFREDIFPDYSQERFEREFSAFFETTERRAIADSQRVIYLMKNRRARS